MTKNHSQFALEALPESLRFLCAGVAALNDVRPETAAMTALTILGGAVGRSATLWRPITQESIAGQLFLVIQSDNGHAGSLAALLAPVREFQRRYLARASKDCDLAATCAKEAQIKARRQRFLVGDPFPEKSHLEYFDYQLRQIMIKRSKLFHVEHPRPGQMQDAFSQSPDQYIFPVWTNPSSFSKTVTFWTTDEGGEEFDLLLKALQEETFTQPASDGGLILEHPGLSGLAVCNGACLKQLIGLDTGFFLETSPVFVLDDNGHSKATIVPVNLTNGLGWWHDRLISLMTARFGQQPRVYRLSSGAEGVLTAAHASEFQHLWENYEVPTCFSADTCIRIMLLLHLCHDNPVEEIMEATARSAVSVLCWLAAERARILTQIENEARAEKRQKDCAVMLEKIREKAPVSKTGLFRSYDVQNQAVLGPILQQLMESGQVIKTSDGMCIAAAANRSAVKTSKRVISSCRTANTANTSEPVSNEAS